MSRELSRYRDLPDQDEEREYLRRLGGFSHAPAYKNEARAEIKTDQQIALNDESKQPPDHVFEYSTWNLETIEWDCHGNLDRKPLHSAP